MYLNPWSKQRVILALQIFDEKVVSGLEYYQSQGHSVRGTLEFIKAVRLLLVGSFVAPSKNDYKYGKIYGADNDLLPRLDVAWKWFAKFQADNAEDKLCLNVKTLLAVSSIRFGFEWVVSEFAAFYASAVMRGERRPYLRAYSFTTNDVEKFFSKQRGSHCDQVDTYDKGVGKIRMMQENKLAIPRRRESDSMTLQSVRYRRRNYNGS